MDLDCTNCARAVLDIGAVSAVWSLTLVVFVRATGGAILLVDGGADDALVDEGSVDAADGATVDAEISVGGELLVLVPIGGGVVDAVASIVPVGAGTC